MGCCKFAFESLIWIVGCCDYQIQGKFSGPTLRVLKSSEVILEAGGHFKVIDMNKGKLVKTIPENVGSYPHMAVLQKSNCKVDFLNFFLLYLLYYGRLFI